MHDEYPRVHYSYRDHLRALAQWVGRRLWLPSTLWLALLSGMLVMLCGWQVLEYWDQNLAIHRPPTLAPLKALPLVLRTYAIDVPRELLTRRELAPEAERLATAELFVPAASKELLDRSLPRSGREYQKASFRFRGILHRVKLRYRGDLYYHWGTRQKSWRVKLRKGNLIDGMRRLNLINPNESMINDHVIYLLAERVGLAAPYSEMVQLKLNNHNFGVVQLCEQVEEEFVRRRGWLPGNIYAGEGIYIDLTRYANSADKAVIWRSTENWEKAADLDSARPHDVADLAALLELVRGADDETFLSAIWDLIDRDAFLRLHLLSLLVQSPHIDNFHNWKLYFDPATGLAIPIPWDLNGLRRTEDSLLGARQAFSTLHARIMQDPRYLEDLAALLEQQFEAGITEVLIELIEEEASKVRPHVVADPLKDKPSPAGNLPQSVRDFEEAVQEMKEMAALSARALWRDVEGKRPDVTIFDEGRGAVEMTITVHSMGGAVLRGLELEVDRVTSCHFFEDAELLAEIVPDSVGLTTASLDRRLRSARRSVEDDLRSPGNLNVTLEDVVLPTRFRFTLTCEDPNTVFRRVAPVLHHGVTGEPLSQEATARAHPSAPLIGQILGDRSYPRLEYPEAQPQLGRSTPPAISEPPAEVVLSGDVQVIEDRYYGPRTVVRILPGTRVSLAAGVSFLVRGRLIAEGTAQAPVYFEPLGQEPWGALVLNRTGLGQNILTHCHLSGGSEARIGRSYYTGMLSAYAADVTLRSSVLRSSHAEDMFNIKSGEFLIEDSLFLDAAFDAIDFDRASGEMRRSLVWRAGNDGVDFGASMATVADTAIAACGDKAMSVGEGSEVELRSTLLLTSVQGIAIKDDSQAVLRDCLLAGNREGVASYRKNLRYAGPGRGRLERCRIVRNEVALRIERGSDFTFARCEFERRVDRRSATVPYIDPDGRMQKLRPEDLERVVFDSCGVLPGDVDAELSGRVFSQHAVASRWAELGLTGDLQEVGFALKESH